MSIDATTHSLFGASKTAADLMVQEYGRYFGMKTACFRGGCLTGPNHSGAQLHGFLSYLMRCVVDGTPYTVFGYKGKQVRDNIHSHDLRRRRSIASTVHRGSARSTTSAAAGSAAAPCSKRSPSARRSPANACGGSTPTRRARVTTCGGSAAHASSPTISRAGRSSIDLRATLEQMLEQHVARSA